MTLNQILAILRARWLAALLAFAVVCGGIVGITLWLPKQYTASATILIDFKNTDPLNGQNFGGVAPISYMVTQVDVIRSGRVVQQVIEKLRLRESAELRAQWQDDADGKGTFESWLMELLRRKLEVRPTKDSGALDINYTSADPRFSAAMANTFADAYMATNLQLRTDPARQSNTFFNTQAQTAREAYEAAQSRLSTFQQKSGLIATEERFDVETARLQELSSQQVVLQALAADARSRNAQVSNNGTQMQEVLGNSLLQQLTADLNRQQVKLEEMRLRLGDSHPSLIEARASVEELRKRISSETGRVTGGVSVSNDVVASRLGAVSAAVADQRAKVLRTKQLRDEAAVLERDVENTRMAFQNLMQRQNLLALESQSERSNVSLLEQASPPVAPSSPRIILNSIIAVVLGLIVALAVALMREWRDRRLRTLDDAKEVLHLKVLCVMPKVSASALARDSNAPAVVGSLALR